jgi:hypothetical protein
MWTLTVYVASAGTPTVTQTPSGPQVGSSALGHMWYSISDGSTPTSFGFAPATPGSPIGPGNVESTDTAEYQNPIYSQTVQITHRNIKR